MYKDRLADKPNHILDDIQVWDQIKAGERAGMEALYIKYAQELFRLGMSIKGDRSLVKDCIQEVFLNLWQYQHTVKTTDNVKLYLFKCLSNKIHKEVGKDKKRYGNLIPEMEENLAYDQGQEQENSIEKRKRLAEVLNSLPARQHEVIQLLYFENHSYENTSAIMGINVQSVYTLAWKAIASLKKGFALISIFFLGFFS
ncbi:RNA polymerase sigma factor [Lunatibacter salilacus]|uniref:RNA polymerase sigma factor n=1 Tax=Lunatibacter salilacus TaxID=2483804 RepID=UPI00131DB1AA|nr:sigma-70 family RNA polymerase sigma factor [Lunatibacter salilacus]